MSWFVGAETLTIFFTERAERGGATACPGAFQNGGAERDAYLSLNVGAAALCDGRRGEQHQGRAGHRRWHAPTTNANARGQAHQGRCGQHAAAAPQRRNSRPNVGHLV